MGFIHTCGSCGEKFELQVQRKYKRKKPRCIFCKSLASHRRTEKEGKKLPQLLRGPIHADLQYHGEHYNP